MHAMLWNMLHTAAPAPEVMHRVARSSVNVLQHFRLLQGIAGGLLHASLVGSYAPHTVPMDMHTVTA